MDGHARAGGIRVEGLKKVFGARVAVEGLTFEVQPGEVFGLLGPNGAGKTTTVRMLTGLLTPSAGRAEVCGLAVTPGNGVALRRRVGLLTEQPGLYERLTAEENLAFFMRLYGVDPARGRALAQGYLARFGLAGREHEPVGGFSKGMRQKLAIIRTLLHEPDVIFLDEPTSGLDPQAARAVRDAVAELAREGRTLVLCSHNLAEVERLCTRVAVVKSHLRTVASLSELRREGLALEVSVDGDAAALEPAVAAVAGVSWVRGEGPLLKVSVAAPHHAPEVVAALVHAGARIHAVVRAARPLEEAYLELVREEDEQA